MSVSLCVPVAVSAFTYVTAFASVTASVTVSATASVTASVTTSVFLACPCQCCVRVIDRARVCVQPHGTNRNALVATKWQNYCIYIVTQKSKMAAANGGYFLKNFKKPITQFVCKIAA